MAEYPHQATFQVQIPHIHFGSQIPRLEQSTESNHPLNRTLVVMYQRKSCKDQTLDADRVKKLNDIRFVWDVHEKRWWDRYQELLDFKKFHGHCNVPNQYPENPILARWVGTQRSKKSKGILNKDYERLLTDIGFKWGSPTYENSETIWIKRFEELRDFKKLHGHCDVPARYKDNPSLGAWLTDQRSKKRKGILSTEYCQMLSNLGVSWGKEEIQRECKNVSVNWKSATSLKEPPLG